MKVIIAGSRSITDYDLLLRTIKNSRFEINEVISGGCRGVDLMGERYAEENDIPIIWFPADWKKHGKNAGPIRNKEMAEYADALIALYDGSSRGTANMIETAIDCELEIYVGRE